MSRSTGFQGWVEVRWEIWALLGLVRVRVGERLGVPMARGMRVVFVGLMNCFFVVEGRGMEEGWFSLSLPVGLKVKLALLAANPRERRGGESAPPSW